jgi:hypothetical protein
MSEKATLLSPLPSVTTQETSAKADSTTSSENLSSSSSSTPLLAPVTKPLLTLPSSEAAVVEKEVVQKAETQALQPVQKEKKISLLSRTRAVEVKSGAIHTNTSVQSTAATSNVSTATQNATQTKATVSQSAATPLLQAIDSSATEEVSADPGGLSSFEVITYASFFLNFILAGAAAVVLFKKATKLAEERFIISAKSFAIACVCIALHGIFATYLYSAHLSDSVSNAPLFLTMAVWVFVGPAVGFITRSLLTRQEKPSRKNAFIDAGIYGLIFFLTACGASSTIKTNAALLFSILAAFLMIVPIARSLTSFNLAKARHKELKEPSDQILVYGLLILPALLPIVAFAHVCGLSDAVTLFLINFITFDFVLVVGLSLLASADEFVPESEVPAEAAVEAPVAVSDSKLAAPEPVVASSPEPVVASSPEPVVASSPEPVVAQKSKKSKKARKSKRVEEISKPQTNKVESGNPDDPIIQFLNSEEGMEVQRKSKPLPPVRPASKPASKSTGNSARVLPPRKPGRPAIKPPAKPGASPASKAPNAPSRLKAPAKPKKRF